MLAEKQDLLLPSKRLLEKSDIDNEYASAKVDMLILYDLNRCSLRITPVEVHEWTPVCAATTQPLCGSGVRQGNYGVQESSTNLVNHHTGSDNPPMTDLQPTSLSHVLDRGSLTGTRPSNNWRSTIGRENLTTADSLLLDLSTRGVDNDETSTFVTTARPQETRHEVIQQNLFNADMFATLSNNNALQEEDYEVDSESCEHGSGLRDVVPTRRSGTRRSARTEELNSNEISHREQQQDCELEKLSDTNMNRHNATRRRTARRSATPTIPTPRRQGQQRRRLKLVLLHSGTQTLGSKINRRWLEPRIIRNAPSAETNMSASAEPEPQLSPTLAARLIAGLQLVNVCLEVIGWRILFDVMELLRLPEAMSNAPYSQQLACQFAGEADKINKHLKAFSSACTRVCMAQDALSEAYIQLSEVARMISNQDSMVQAKNSDFEQTGLQFSSFLEELSVLHQRFSDELRSSMFTPAHKLPSQPNLQLTGSNPETIIRFSSTSDTQRNYDSCEHEMEVALKNYMKLSKRCTPKQHDDTVQELSKRRWLFKRAAVIYHARLNAAHFERDLVPLAAFHGFLNSLRLHTERVSQMTTLQSMTEFCETIKSQQDCRQVQATEATADFLNTLSRIECHPLEVFAPEPLLAKTDNTYLRSPNTKLLKKSGYLYLRTRKAFITDWIEVFCFTQGGNLLCQSKSELAASVLVNLNGKGVFAEPVDCDDRRYTFHIVSATEKRTVILQAENSTDRDEWIATLSNVIIATNGWSAKELAEAADGGSPSRQPPQMIADSQLSMDLLRAEEADLQTALRLSMSCQAWVSQSPPPALLNLLSVMSGNCKDSVSATNFETSFQLKFVGALQLAEHLNDPSSLNEASDYIIAQSAAQTPQSCLARLSNTAVWLFDAPIGEDAGLQQQLAYFPLAQITSCLTSSKDGRHVIFLISPPHSETDNGLPPGDLPWCLTFETDSPNEISECVLAAQLNRVTSLTEASDLAEKSKLVAIISRSSNFGDAPRLDSQSARTPASAGFDQNLGTLPPGASSPPTHVVPKPAGTAADDSAAAASPPSSAEATQQQPSTPAAAAGELPVTPSSEQKSDLTDAVAAPCGDYQAEKEPSTVE
nr:unnamed protein product [Spirometra erinaceieuropaei]